MNDNPYSVSEHQDSGDPKSPSPKFDQQLRAMQVIAVALMMGLLSFLFVVLVVTQGDVLNIKNPDVLSLIAIGFATVITIVHFVIPGVISKAQLQQAISEGIPGKDEATKSEKLCAIFQTSLIIGLAMLEGAAFFNLVVLLIEKNAINLVVVIVLLTLMLVKFPTKTKLLWWVQDRMRELP